MKLRLIISFILLLGVVAPSPAAAAEPVWPGTNTRYYPGIYARASGGTITSIGNTLHQWWGDVDRTRYRELQNGQRATHIGIKVNLHADDFFSSYWHNSASAPYDYRSRCDNSPLMQNPDAIVSGQRVYDWDLFDSVLALPLIANGEAKVIFYYDDQDVAFTKSRWWESQGMLDDSGAHPKKYDWVYTRLKMDFLKAWATRYRNNPKIAALHFEEHAGVEDDGPTCGYVVPGQSWQVSAEHGTFFYPAKAVLEADPGLMVFKVGAAVGYIPHYFDGFGAGLGLNDLPGAQGMAMPDARFFSSGCGSGAPGAVDCEVGGGYWLTQQALVRNDLPTMTHAEFNGWRILYDGTPPNTRRSNAQNPWGVPQWGRTDSDWDGENFRGVPDGSSHDFYAFPDPMFWVWYFSGPPRAVGAAADSGLGQAGPDPAGVIPSVMYEPVVPWCTGWGCWRPNPEKISDGWNGTNLSINRYRKAFEVFGPSGTKAMFDHPPGYLESFGDEDGPTVTFSASPTSISPGGSSTLTWSSSGATACTAAGGWTGAKPTSGTQSVSPTTATTYDLTCMGSTGSTFRSVTVTVTGGSTTGSTSGSTTGGTSGSTSGSTTGLPGTFGCSLFTPATPIPTGFASAFHVGANNPTQALVSASCSPTAVSLSVGTGFRYMYIYKTAYVSQAGTWQPIALSGGTRSGDWIVGSASYANYPISDITTQTHFAAAYICTWYQGAWKCGCRDAACTGDSANKWSLQAFKKRF